MVDQLSEQDWDDLIRILVWGPGPGDAVRVQELIKIICRIETNSYAYSLAYGPGEERKHYRESETRAILNDLEANEMRKLDAIEARA
jgi:hypothetical protein